ncbi:hypothetical protein AVEN_195779-1 [Araneus ventricosus]|uniref:Uncharacterized protein n=1 Tax=Araneus ventricosus TaxID=182803 RepID=A0A4Y2L4H3_ARAVE|nr:hypothetical protein AVEN_195779-1 [Araneus ventricosus]
MHQKLAVILPRLVSRNEIFCSIIIRDHTFPEQLSQKYTACITRLFLTLHTLQTFRQPNTTFSSRGREMYTNETTARNSFEKFLGSRIPDYYVTSVNDLVSRWERCTVSNNA